jgi:HlyD family secretion protein
MDGGIALDLQSPITRMPRPKRRRFRLWWVAVVVVAIGGLGWRYCVPLQVDGLVVAPRPFATTVSGPGLLDALVKVEVSARVEGRIVDLPVEQNDVVPAGTLIARLDAPDIVQQLSQTRADAEAARLGVLEAENDRLGAKAGLVHAQAEFDRKVALLRTSDATHADYDAARATLDQKAASLARAEAAVQRARSSAEAAQAAARVMEARLADSTMLAPVAGVVTVRNHSLGDVLTPGASIVELVNPKSIIISTRFDESAMGGIVRGQPVEIRFTSFPGRVFQGRVLRLGRSVDTATREFTVDVTPLELPPHWAIGQRASVTVTTGIIPNAITVPDAALAPRAGKQGVWVATSASRAQWRQVRVGSATNSIVKVTQGIVAGDIVLAQPASLYAWAPIHVVLNRSAQ